jgi:predicted DNA-binding protein (MmcQ/YjbR family)
MGWETGRGCGSGGEEINGIKSNNMNLDKLRTLCMSFPGATEGLKWEDHICFMVGEKMFCMTGADWHGANFKVTDEEFEELIERNGIVPTPYMARNKWVTVEDYSKLKPKEWEFFVTQSYNLIRSKLPKKVQNSL